MKPIHWRIFSVSLLLAAAWPLHAQPVQAPDAVALGLIIGFRPNPEDPSRLEAQHAAGRSDPKHAQVAWEQKAQRGREHLRQVAREAGLPLHGVGEAGNAHLLRFERPLRGQALQDVVRRARLHPDVAWVEPNVLLKRLQAAPNDPGYAQQWHLQAPAEGSVSAINMPSAWALTTGSAAVTVAVLDTGILPHPDLVGRTWAGYDFVSEVAFAGDGSGRDADPTDPGDWVTFRGNDPAIQQMVDAEVCEVKPSSWHGSFITGQIAAVSNNFQGVSGINWANKVLPVRVAGKCGAFLSDILDGMRWAAGLPVAGVPANPNPARIINLSFGGDTPCDRNTLYQSAIDDVTAHGALVVVASGNSSGPLMRPADCQRVLAVGAVRQDGLKTDYSSFGPQMGLMAPGGSGTEGVLLYSTANSGVTTAVPAQDHYGQYQGSSFAAPLVAGVASLMLSMNPALSPAQLVQRMRMGVRPWSSVDSVAIYPTCSSVQMSQSVCNCTTQTCGTGLLDAGLAVRMALGPAAVIAPVNSAVPGSAVPLDGRLSVPIPGATITRYVWQQLDGPSVSITSPNAALTSVTLSSVEASYVFRLTVTDSEGRTGSEQVTVVASAPVVSGGGGGGASSWFWGAFLWVWVLAVGWAARRRPLMTG